jgi:hypothetical protein
LMHQQWFPNLVGIFTLISRRLAAWIEERQSLLRSFAFRSL